VERIKLKINVNVECGGYGCSINCPLHSIAGFYLGGVDAIIGGEIAAYSTCAVVLVWAEFYGLY
jgi:hypothetical protein